jgi:hypothetical protein
MPASTIPDKVADADSVLLAWCAAALRRLGADVRIRERAENSVRVLAPPSCGEAPGSAPVAPVGRVFAAPACAPFGTLHEHEGEAIVRIDVEGVPNLLHELVHVVLAGRLDDDHGFDYRAIPYDLRAREGRGVLWNELSACVVSCAYLLPRELDAACSGGVDARVDGWFDEQLGIQPIFYGHDDDPARFFAALPGLAVAHAPELGAVTCCAYERMAALLRWAGAPPRWAEPARALDFAELWSRRELARGAAA